jgi:hypothetical protein
MTKYKWMQLIAGKVESLNQVKQAQQSLGGKALNATTLPGTHLGRSLKKLRTE